MEEKFKESFKQAAAFQKMWMDSMSGMTRVWSEYSPKNPPPDELKKVRNGVLKAVSQTWEEYMRTPEFMQMMKETMNNSVQWQKWAKDNTNKMHSALGSASKDDIQGVLVAVQHVERRVLDCLGDMEARMNAMQSGMEGVQAESGKSLGQYQKAVMAKLAELEKRMKKPAPKAAAANPKAVKPVRAKKPAAGKSPAKKAAAKKVVARKSAAKKAASKASKPKTSKAK